MREHVEKAAAAGVPSAIERLDAAKMPLCLEHVFGYYWELRAAIPDGLGRSPITFQEIEAWMRCVHVELAPWEIRCIRMMDIIHWQTVSKKDQDDPKRRGRE